MGLYVTGVNGLNLRTSTKMMGDVKITIQAMLQIRCIGLQAEPVMNVAKIVTTGNWDDNRHSVSPEHLSPESAKDNIRRANETKGFTVRVGRLGAEF